MIQRRGLLAGLGALLAAPAIIRTPGLLMPVRPIERASVRLDFVGGGGIVFLSTPNGLEGGEFWRRWMAKAAEDVAFLTGIDWTEDAARLRGEGA